MLKLLGETSRRVRRKATTHQETLRVAEEDGEEEEEDTGEEVSSLIVVVEAEVNHMTMTLIEEIKNIKNGMTTRVTAVVV